MTNEQTEQTEPTAEQRRAELPGLGYTDKFSHGEESLEDAAVEEQDPEDGEEDPRPSPSPATTQQAPPPVAQPWTLGHGAGE